MLGIGINSIRPVKVINGNDEGTPTEQDSVSTVECSAPGFLKRSPETSPPWGFQVYNTIEEREREERNEMDGEESAHFTAYMFKVSFGIWWDEP